MTTRILHLLAFVLMCAAAVAPGAHASGDPLSRETPYTGGPVPGTALCDDGPLSAKRPVSLPADDAPHHGDRNTWEWWYWKGHLKATPIRRTSRGRRARSKRFSYMVAFEWKPQMQLQQTAYFIGDVGRGKMHYGRQGDLRGNPAVTVNGFSLRGPHSSAAGGDGRDRVHIDVDDYVLDIGLVEEKRPVLHFGAGHASLYCQNAFYYQRPRMKVSGRLVKDGIPMRVSGVGTFDHSWGLTAGYAVAQSQYLEFTLRDGTDIFLGDVYFPPDYDAPARFRAPEGSKAYLRFGSISDRHGNVETLDSDDFTLTPTGYFRPSSTCSYPVDYDVTVKGRHYRVRPTIRDSEIRSGDAPLNHVLWMEDATFWDGEISVAGAGKGVGWLDLVRWCPGR